MDSYSGIIADTDDMTVASSERFTDITLLPCKGFNILCKARRYGRWWMLKGLKEPYKRQPTYRELLQKEFDILISMQHPGIVAASSIEDVPTLGRCIVMEWIDGTTLQEWIERRRCATEKNGDRCHATAKGKMTAEGEALFAQLLDAVAYVHAKQVAHRDLKPSNIMITHDGCRVKLIDFGLADADSYAILKQPAGTPSYMSPEQKMSWQTDIRNDIYSLGCILERMQLGNVYAPVVKRCKTYIDRRYANIDAMRIDFATCKNRQHIVRKRMAYAVVVCALLAASIGYGAFVSSDNSAANMPANDTPVEQEPEVHNASNGAAAKQDSQTTAEPHQHAVASSPQATTQFISDGKKAIDRMWQSEGIDTIHGHEAQGNALCRFVDKSNRFITIDYPQTIVNKIAESQKTDIVYELSAYTAEKYVKPTMARLQSAE